MVCPKCGAQISDGATFCPVCGAAALQNNQQNNQYYNPPVPPQGGMNNRNDKAMIIIICAAAAAALFVVVAVTSFLLMGGGFSFGAKETPTPIPTVEPEPTPVPIPTPQIVYVPVQAEEPPPPPQEQVGGYRTYYNGDYGFSCDYPASFVMYDDGGTLTLHTVRSPDWSGIERIVAMPNSGETVGSSSSQFLANHPGEVTYSSTGSDYYALTVRCGEMEYYRYCKFAKGNLYWFEFEYPSSQHDMYDVYINDVYRSFSY